MKQGDSRISGRRTPFRLGLISMPWALCNRPSIQLGALKSFLQHREEDLPVAAMHPFLGLTKVLGPKLYQEISSRVWLCEGLYAGLLFPQQREILRPFLAREITTCAGAAAPDPDALWQRLEAHLRGWLAEQDWSRFDLLGFSVCFNQLLASLYAAREIRALRPDLPVVFGGSSCLAEMGRSLLRTFSWLDYVVHGEGELPLLNLCRVLAGREGSLLPQVLTRQAGEGAALPAGCQLAGLAELPVPDHDDYFAELGREFAAATFLPELPVEFSRGCWWGRCVFCNLNLQWRGYRSKSAEQMAREVAFLADRHACLDFSFTDNVLPLGCAEDFFTAMASSAKDVRFFAEIRMSQRGRALRTYRRGGLVRVQAGIEALSQGLLVRMAKGATVIENLALMKESLELGIRLDGNLITEFPLSTPEEVAETLVNLDFVLPFTPLTTASFFLGQGCGVAQRPADYGIRALVPHAHNRKLFPPDILQGLTLLIGDYRGDRRAQRALWRPVLAKVRAWRDFHQQRRMPAHLAPPLSLRDGGDFLLIRQELPDRTLHHRLRGLSRRIYLACAGIRDFAELQGLFPGLDQGRLLAFLDELAAKRLLFAQGTRYLALAVRSAAGGGDG